MDEKSRLKQIREELNQLDISPTFFARKEIKELPNILSEGEKIIYLVEGRNKTTKHHIVLVGTDRRLIFIDKEFLYGLKVEDYSYDKVASIQYETSFMLASIDVNVSGDIVEIDGVGKYEAELFCEKVRDFMSRPKEFFQTKSEPTILDQLEQLGRLKESGVLTEQEFDEQKRNLLEKL
ncbi:PH domain-containing protein [Chryseobacterium chendengshani]|uniref:PH domain-containing protein n=1 Tax=unclassified Chryseobacterium TaxID=2593645 RepID=UPI001C644A6B|nr:MULTISPECIES: PH domain-containing protein [unclassified Chryseobacterium]MBW7674695.1 PH domain-containing protein [Chryseobacterium sp. LJ756]MBW8522514.1 PH domain-containing protein [Chryseobacterium sp. LJ668]QYK18144.1 PH domain-containing protein [Chryseobacterium sp. LJ668]